MKRALRRPFLFVRSAIRIGTTVEGGASLGERGWFFVSGHEAAPRNANRNITLF